MSAVKRDIIIDQGADFSLSLTWESPAGSPVDLTGYTAALVIRSTYGAQPEVLALAQGSGITLGGAAGTIAIAITAATLADASPCAAMSAMARYLAASALCRAISDLADASA